jgi:2-polyprenyl-3-methyl-5-hydroxy-6-metoxy-1,4-benzoquinol methylase
LKKLAEENVFIDKKQVRDRNPVMKRADQAQNRITLAGRTLAASFAQLLKRYRKRPLVISDKSATGSKDGFFIKDDYVPRSAPDYCDVPPDQDTVWQPDVYSLAGALPGIERIIDVGCGNGEKLLQFHPMRQIVGMDIGDNLAYCRKTYDFGQWIEHNLEMDSPFPLGPELLKNSVLVCADIIEHLIDPIHLLRNLKKCLEIAPAVLISTPERDVTRGTSHKGPPPNPFHVREWNMSEFRALLEDAGFNITFIGLTASNSLRREMKTIITYLTNASVTPRS